MTEDQLEQEALDWLGSVGYTHLYGPDTAFDGSAPERPSNGALQTTMPARQ